MKDGSTSYSSKGLGRRPNKANVGVNDDTAFNNQAVKHTTKTLPADISGHSLPCNGDKHTSALLFLLSCQASPSLRAHSREEVQESPLQRVLS